jgi:uncharacterized protein (DUF486 family)
MYSKSLQYFIIILLMIVGLADHCAACSMYKVTANGRTMVGNNEDSWGQDARIWFEPGDEHNAGVVCVGYARKKYPDGAINEHGLVFDAIALPHRTDMPERDPKKKDFGYPTLLTVMRQCRTVDEVATFLEPFNLHVLNGSPLFYGCMLLFVDPSGAYLVVEASKMTRGTEDRLALANFSVAHTPDPNTVRIERYRKGVEFMNNKMPETSLSYCEALSDTMSVCRAKVGDGTLFTTIYDLQEGLIHLYFFHDFTQRVTFHIKEELARGARSVSVESLFPPNAEYAEFIAYQTPVNNQVIFIFILCCAALFFSSAAVYGIRFLFWRKVELRWLNVALAVWGIALFAYMLTLLFNQGIFYFPAPYTTGASFWIAVSSYLPVVLLVLFVPFLVFIRRLYQSEKWGRGVRWLLLANQLAYVGLLGLFAYWGLLEVVGD